MAERRPATAATAAFTGARLTSLLTQPATGPDAAAQRDLFRTRCARFVTCLASARDERATYDLRLVVRPVPDNPSRSDVRLYLLARRDGATSEEAAEFSRETLSLLQAEFPEHGFDLISDEELAAALNPFQPKSLICLTRRSSLEDLDTLRSPRRRYSFGFLGDHTAPIEIDRPAEALYHVFPFLPGSDDVAVLLRYLVTLQASACISIRLQPTTLTAAEEGFLEAQIGACEKYLRLRQVFPADEARDFDSALRRQADVLRQFQQRMLFGLWDDAALMTIEITSAASLPRQLVDLVGSLVTGPAGGVRPLEGGHFGLYFAGGYDAYDRSGDSARATAFRELRMYPVAPAGAPTAAQRLVHLFDAAEAACAFRLPACPSEEFPGLDLHYWRSLPPPRQLPDTGTFLGINHHHQSTTPVHLADTDRSRHLYVIGQTGTGKTTLLRSLMLADMEAGRGLCVVDPHGDLYADLLGRIPVHRRDDVVLLDPTDSEFPVGLNLLQCDSEWERYFVAQELVGIFSRLLADEYGSEAAHFTGPIFYQQMRMNLLLLMSKPDRPGTILDFYALFQSKDYWKRWTPTASKDPSLKRWVEEVLPRTDYQRMSDDTGTSLGMYVGSKFENLVFDPRLRNIFGQRRSTIDLRDIIDERKILLVNLAKGSLTEQNSRFLGMVLLAKLVATVLGRSDRPEAERKLFHLYVDEFQSLATDNFVTLLSEARKFGLSLVLANQFLSQVRNQRIVDAIFGNVGTIIAFRLGHQDAELLEPQFAPDLSRRDLINLPNWVAYVRTLAEGQRAAPFNVATTLAVPDYQPGAARSVRDHSRQQFSRPRSDVEYAIGQH